MAAPPPPGNSRLQNMLQTAVQTVQWTYSIFWQLCRQQGILVWGDGYYNGAIKTRKTVLPVEVSTEEASLQRSQQLRELYDSLSAGETNQPVRRPSAALSPEDLTESEWFYLMCVSFSFPPGVGLPGKAYAKRQHVWLTGANDFDGKIFTRAILAKSARVQTVVCIPLLDGVVELGTTERVKEDLGLIQQVKSIFAHHHHTHAPKPALSEQSTSNPTSKPEPTNFYSPTVPPPEPLPSQSNTNEMEENIEDELEEEEDEEEEEEDGSDSEAEMDNNSRLSRAPNPHTMMTRSASVIAAELTELMQLDMSEDIRVGSPDDASNNLNSDFHLLAMSQAGDLPDHHIQGDSYRLESTRRWPVLHDPLNDTIQPPSSSGAPLLEELTQEDSHYSQTVSTILQHQCNRWSDLPASAVVTPTTTYHCQSAFTNWPPSRSDYHHHHHADSTSQWLLKYILFSVPFLHSKKHNSVDPASRFLKGGSTTQDELSANHVLAERRRRQKLNERFIILRSLVPFVTKMDKASILGDTIEYVKQLLKKIQDLEARTRQMEADQRSKSITSPPQKRSKEQRITTSINTMPRAVETDKRKMRIVEGSVGGKPKVVESSPPPQNAAKDVQVEVSIIESDALVELQCPYREGLLLDVMQKLRELRVEITTVQSSMNNGVFFVAELRAKVKESVNGKRLSIVEVRRAINQIIPRRPS